MIRYQYMQGIIDKMKHGPYWDTISESYDTLTLLKRIDKTILYQTKYQYCYAIVYNKECKMYGFYQHNLKNEKYYERFNTKVDAR